jgi:hypothetical protein
LLFQAFYYDTVKNEGKNEGEALGNDREALAGLQRVAPPRTGRMQVSSRKSGPDGFRPFRGADGLT